MRRLILVGLSTLFVAGSTPKVKANPAIFPAAPAICATGVGCVLLGTVVVGGSVAYVWQNGGQRFVTNAVGNILRYLDDPEGEPQGTWEDPLNTKDWYTANKLCSQKAARMGASYRVRKNPATGLMSCIFTGGTIR